MLIIFFVTIISVFIINTFLFVSDVYLNPFLFLQNQQKKSSNVLKKMIRQINCKATKTYGIIDGFCFLEYFTLKGFFPYCCNYLSDLAICLIHCLNSAIPDQNVHSGKRTTYNTPRRFALYFIIPRTSYFGIGSSNYIISTTWCRMPVGKDGITFRITQCLHSRLPISRLLDVTSNTSNGLWYWVNLLMVLLVFLRSVFILFPDVNRLVNVNSSFVVFFPHVLFNFYD